MSRSFCQSLKLTCLGLLILALLINTACLSVDMTSLPELEIFGKVDNPDSLVPLNQQASGHLSPLNLAQALAFAINGDYKVEDIYQSLPAASRVGVSLEAFRAYIKALTPAEDEKISSFVDLGSEVKRQYQDKVLSYEPELTDLALTSQYYRFYTVQNNSPRGRVNTADDGFVLAIQVSSKGWGYLSPAWMAAVVKVQDFASFYFSALEDEAMTADNPGPLAFLLEQESPAFEGPGLDTYYLTKAQAISDFYMESVTTLPKAARASCLLPGYASYMQEYRYGSRLSSIREVEFQQDQDRIRVVEPIRESLDSDQARLLVYDLDLFSKTAGASRNLLNSQDLHPLLGPLVQLEELPKEGDTEDQVYRASYYGLTFVFKGQADLASKTWQGSLESLEITSQIYSLGGEVHVGMALADFYQLHPFFSDNNQIFRMNAIFPELRLDYESKDGVISKLILSRAG